MSPVRPLLVAVVSLVALPMIAAGATAGTTTWSATTTIAIDGVAAGAVLEWEGGDPRATVVTATLGTTSGGGVSKQLGSLVYAPLVLKIPFTPSAPILELIKGLCSNSYPRKKILLTEFDAMGNATSATEFDGALIREVRFPALDAASSAPGSATLVFDVESSSQVPPTAVTTVAATRATAAPFRLVIDNLDGKGVTEIGALSIRLKMTDNAIGEARISTSTPAGVEFSNLTANLLRAKAETWRAWFTNFVIKGNCGDDNEKSGTLEFLSADMKQVVFALHFEHLGILRLSRVSTATGAPETVQAELYFEKLSTGTGQTGGGSDAPTQDAGGGTQDGASQETPEVDAAPQPVEAVLAQDAPMQTATGMLSSPTPTDTSGTPVLNVSDRLTSGGAIVTESATTPTRAVTVVGATSPVTNPADQGSRDPAGFPRVAGLTRLDFSGQYYATSTQEESHYTTPDKAYDLLVRVDSAAKAEGWTLGNFAEGYSQGDKWITEQWTKDNSAVALEIDQPDAGLTRYWIRIITKKPEAN